MTLEEMQKQIEELNQQLAEKDALIRQQSIQIEKQSVQIENMLQAILHARKERFGTKKRSKRLRSDEPVQ